MTTDITEPIDGGGILLLSISPSFTILLFKLPEKSSEEDNTGGADPPPDALVLNIGELFARCSILVLLREISAEELASGLLLIPDRSGVCSDFSALWCKEP